MDIGKSFTFVFEDPNWVRKLLIGSGIALLGMLLFVTIIGGFLGLAPLFGYCLRVSRNVVVGEAQVLPEWEDWSGLFREGMKFFAVIYGLVLPIIAIGLILLIPGIALATSENEALIATGIALSGGGYCLIFLLSFVYTFILPVPVARLAVTGSMSEAFRPGATFALLRANIADYLIIFLLVSFVISLVAYLGLIAFLIGIFASIVYSLLISHHLYGQAYLRALARQGAAPPGPAQPTRPI